MSVSGFEMQSSSTLVDVLTMLPLLVEAKDPDPAAPLPGPDACRANCGRTAP